MIIVVAIQCLMAQARTRNDLRMDRTSNWTCKNLIDTSSHIAALIGSINLRFPFSCLDSLLFHGKRTIHLISLAETGKDKKHVSIFASRGELVYNLRHEV